MTAVLQLSGNCDTYYNPVQEERILPVQLLSPPPAAWTRFLLSLLVEEAIADVLRPLPEKKGNFRNKAMQHQREARAWLASDERSLNYPTFHYTCDYLGLEPYSIRRAIAKPGFRLATEWTTNSQRGLRHEKCGGVDLLDKIDKKAQRRKRHA